MTSETAMTEVTDDLNAFEASFLSSEPPVEAPKVETPAPEEPKPAPEQAETESESAEESEDAGDEDTSEETSEQPKKRSTAERIKKMTRELRHYQRQAEEVSELRAQLEAMRAGKTELTPEKKPVTEDGPKAPDANSFKYGELDPQYLEALADYRADLKISAFRESLRQEQEQTQQRSAAEREVVQLRDTATAIEQAGVSKFPDFKEIVVEGAANGEWALTKEMLVLASETSAAPEILYYLASNPDESERVSTMSERQQAMWFGRLEVEMKAVTEKPAARKVTQAPTPAANIPKGSGSKSGPSFYDINDPRALDALEREMFGR